MSVNLEIERKFLLKNLDVDAIRDARVYHITQYYVGNKRFRAQTEKQADEFLNDVTRYYLTVKTPVSAGVNSEDETELTSEQFAQAMEQADRLITKFRYVVDMEQDSEGRVLKWEIDRFTNLNLILAEIELPEMEYGFCIPEWMKSQLIREVTGDSAFSNKNLAIKTK